MANTKLLKVMDYLINEQEDKARELLHQIFIEKARAIHEEMMAHDDDMEEDMMGGNMGEKLADEIDADKEAIEGEEHYAPMEDMEADDDIDVEDAVEDLGDELDVDSEDADDMDMEDEDEIEIDSDDEDMDVDMDVDMPDADMDMEDEEATGEEALHDIEQAIAELRAEFAELKKEVEHGGEHDDMDDMEDKVDEAWETEMPDDLDEVMHDDDEHDEHGLAENIDLDTVQAAKGGEVGSGKFARADVSKRSPVPSTQTATMGAKPVVTGKGPKAGGYDRQAAPSADHMGPASNRKKKATDGMSTVSKEGSTKALLNKDRSEGYGAIGTKSPIQGR